MQVFYNFAAIYTDEQSKFVKMKVKSLLYKIGIMVWSLMLFAACSIDNPADDATTSDTDQNTVDSNSQHSQFGDFEIIWTYSAEDGKSQVIGKGIFHAEQNNTSTFGFFMDAENNMTKFFVDQVFKKDYQTMEPQKVTVDVDGVIYNSFLQYGFVGYSADAYYYNIKNWQYSAIAKIDDTFYQFTPIPDYEKSSMSFDTKSKQWMGVITIKQVHLCEAYTIPAPWTEKYVMSPRLTIVFSTTKKIK